MERIPIVIDTDPGIDDFFCLALACAYSDRLDLRAVTTMGGNNHTDVTTQNALNILSLFRTDVPVARGADRYLEAEFGAPAAKCHGSNGVGNLVLLQSDRTPDDLPAWDKLYEIAKAAQGELVLVTVAPLTNIALALQKHPDLPHWIKKIVMMGGSIGRGNITPYVEANAGHDPAATKLVFESGIPIDMVGLSITLGCPIRPDVFERYIPAQRGGFREIMEALIRFRSGEAMHDAVAISTLLDDRLMTWQTGEITVELAPPERSGQTVLHPSEHADMRAAVAVDCADIMKYYGAMTGLPVWCVVRRDAFSAAAFLRLKLYYRKRYLDRRSILCYSRLTKAAGCGSGKEAGVPCILRET